MNLNVLVSNPEIAKNITLQVTGENLLQFAEKLVTESSKETRKQLKEEAKAEEYLTRKEVATMFNVDISTIHNWCKSKKLKPLGIGSRVYFLRSDIEQSLTPLNS